MKNSLADFPLATVSKYWLHLLAPLAKAWQQLQRWWVLAEQRRKLALLDEHALHDLGLSRADAICESERSFWDDPLATTLPVTTELNAQAAPGLARSACANTRLAS